MTLQLEAQSLAKRYARALADETAKDYRVVAKCIEGFLDACRDVPDLARLLKDPRVELNDRKELCRAVLEKMQAPIQVVRLGVELVVNSRLALLQDMLNFYVMTCERRQGIQRVTIQTARALPEAERESIRSKLAEWLRKDVRLEERIRPELLGGVDIQIGSRVWYGSVRHKLSTTL